MKITYEILRENLLYNENTGEFTTIHKRGRASVGVTVGAKTKDGYIQISIFGSKEYAHRLAWLYKNGEYPKYQIDHINGNKEDNRIENLRDVTINENSKNRPKDKHNKNDVVGVSFRSDTKKWRADIHVDKKHISLGSFNSYDAALNARREAEITFGFHTNHGRMTA